MNPLEFWPIPFAVDQRGRVIHWELGRGSMLVAGTTGSGKSSIPRAVAVNIASSEVVQPVGIDLKAVEFRYLEPRLAALATEVPDAVTVLEQVLTILDARKVIAAAHGWRQWPATYRHPFIPLLADELAELDSPFARDALARIGRLGRALGINILGATQRAEAAVIGGADLRNNFAWRFVMASLDFPSYGLALGVADDVINDLAPRLSVRTPGLGIVLEPGHELRVARVAWFTDAQVDAAIAAGRRHTVDLEWLVEWAVEDAVATKRKEQVQ